jgi:hypothetical protein
MNAGKISNKIIFLLILFTMLIGSSSAVLHAQITPPSARYQPSYIPSSNGLPTIGQWPYDTRIGDVNNDGHLDIIRLRGHDDFNQEDKGFQIWLGDGTGNWTKTYIPNGNFGYGGTAIGDFNNDGNLDAAYGVHHNGNHPLIGAWTGDGGTSFTEHSTGLATDGEDWGMAPIDFGDFNNDGWLDIGVGSFGADNGVRAYENLNQGTSWISRSTGLPHNDRSPNAGNWFLWEDLNRDGFLDILMAIQYVIPYVEHHFIWLGDGTGNWTNNDFSLPAQWLWGSYGLDSGDVNNDGWPDVTFIKKIGSIYVPAVYVFDGTSWTETSAGLPTSSYYMPLAFGDLDNNGNLDLVGLERISSTTTIHAWLGNGAGYWTEISPIATGIPGSPESVTLADIDHNNYLDIIISSDQGDYEPGGIRVYKNTNPAEELAVTLRKPLGGQVYIAGSLRTIEWTSSIPSGTATITLEYSVTGNQGPWSPIVADIIDTNIYQWTVPNVNTSTAFIKGTIHSNGDSASDVTPRPITIIGDNTPPTTPILTGPTSGEPNLDYEFTITSTDVDGDMLSYFVDWGDGTTSDWVGPVPSGTPMKLNHAWSTPGTYSIKGKARDSNNVESSWSDALQLNISITTIEVRLKPGVGVQMFIKNTGTTDLPNIPWNITIKGGIIFYGRFDEGTISLLQAGQEKSIRLFPIGFGRISIMANVQETTANATGMLVLFFVFGFT